MKRLRTWTAALTVALASDWVAAPVSRADERTDARREFRSGMQLISEGQYDEGISHLEKAYDILPHPNVLYNIALGHVYAGRPEAALDYLERYKETAEQSQAVEVDAMMARLRAAATSATRPSGPETAESAQAAARAAAQQPGELDVVTKSAAELGQEAESANRDVTVQTPAQAQTRVQQEARQGVYEEEVVSASRLAQSPLDAPNATAIITAQDIRLTGITNLNDLLRRVAGVEVNSVAPNHAEVSIRGLNRRTSNKVLLLLDGRSLRQDFLGSAWYEFLPVSLEDVERIEVIRGPASALYGADAFSGIINIITRTPGEGSSFVSGGVGNHGQARGAASFNGREGELTYHFGMGYAQANHAVNAVGEGRVDVQPLTDSPDVTNKRVWANAELRYPLAKRSIATVGSNIVYGDQTVQGLSRLLQVSVDDLWESQVYGTITTPVGLRLGAWWNHLDGNAGSSYLTPGAIDAIAHDIRQEVADVDVSWSDTFDLLVPHTVTLGGGYRYKAIRLSWLDGDHTQHHVSAYVQDAIQLAKQLRVQLGARVDRHPLLRSLQFSPRGSLTVRFLDNQSLRATVGRAFRGPSFLESYLEFPNGSPLRGVSAWGIGNDELEPESITSFELGYTNQASDYVSFELNAYYNLVKNAILFSEVTRFTLQDFANDTTGDLSAFDPSVEAFPVSSLRFVNEDATFRQVGGEAGARFYPVTGLDLYTNYAIHDTSPVDDEVDPVRAREQQTSRHKINGGIQYRAPFGLDTSLDVHWYSKQIWVEQVTDLAGVRFESFRLPSFIMVNARLGYRFLNDRIDVGIVGTNLAHQIKRQHPFGQPMDTRVMGTAKVRF